MAAAAMAGKLALVNAVVARMLAMAAVRAERSTLKVTMIVGRPTLTTAVQDPR